MAAPGRLGGVEVKAGAHAEVPVVGLAYQPGTARAGVGADEGQPQLRRHPLGAGFEGKGLFGAGQARQKQQRRHRPVGSLRRQVDAEAHRQADFGGKVLVKALHAAEAGVLAEQFKLAGLHDSPAFRYQ